MISHYAAFLHILINGIWQEIFNLVRGVVESFFDPKQTTGEFLLKISIPLLAIGGRFLFILMKESREEKEAIKAVQRTWEWEKMQKEYSTQKKAPQQSMSEIIASGKEEKKKSKEDVPASSSYRVLVIIAVVLPTVMLAVLIKRFH